MSILADFLPGLPEIFLALAALVLLMVGVFRGDDSLNELTYGTIGVLGIALIMVLRLGGFDTTGFNGLFITNGFTQFCKVIILFSVGGVLYMSSHHLDREGIGRFEYPVLILLSTLGMMMMVSANDLMALFVGLELHSLASYILVALQRDRLASSEAGIKYFILGALSTVFILYGSTFVYGFTGTTEFSGVLAVLKTSPNLPLLVALALIFLISGMAFKISLVPFHMWTPDVYEGSPTPVTAFLTSAPKLAAFALLVRVSFDVFGLYMPFWQEGLLVLCLGSMVLGSFAGLFQTNIKRLLAYSSISHMGYAGLGLLGGTPYGIQSLLVYLTLYVVMSIGVFACLLCLRRYGKLMENLGDLTGLSKDSPPIALSLALLLFSLAGVPPLGGFFAKLNVFMAAIKSGFYITAVMGVLTSVVAAAYYIKIVKIMYFDSAPEGGALYRDEADADPGGEGDLRREAPLRLDPTLSRQTVAVMLFAVLATVGFSFFPDYLMKPAYAAAKALVFNPFR